MDIFEKYYRVYAEIDLDAVFDNVKALKGNISEKSGIIAVVKADGYGHGAIPIAKTINELVNAYAVATVQEAFNLREHNLNKPIYIIGFTHSSSYRDAINQDIRLTVYDEETAIGINNAAGQLEKTARVHIKLDTGMSRIGFKDDNKSIEIIKRISNLENIQVEGIFTHFSASDSRDKESAYTQLARFQNFINSLEKQNIHIPVIHCSNSAGIIDLPETAFTEVRAGIAIYGLYPSDEVNKCQVNLRSILALKSHIVQLKNVEKGTGIGYGSTFITNRETKIATVSIGYGDGYPRNLSNKGYVLIKGQKAPIIGRVCMDYIMVDVTDISDVNNGDTVTLIGIDGKEEITVDELAKLAGTFNYEFVCDIGKRIPRIYYKNNEMVCNKDYFNDSYIVNL